MRREAVQMHLNNILLSSVHGNDTGGLLLWCLAMGPFCDQNEHSTYAQHNNETYRPFGRVPHCDGVCPAMFLRRSEDRTYFSNVGWLASITSRLCSIPEGWGRSGSRITPIKPLVIIVESVKATQRAHTQTTTQSKEQGTLSPPTYYTDFGVLYVPHTTNVAA